MHQVLVALITAAFLVTALSGLVLAFPLRLAPLFGTSLPTWRSIHEWSALAFTVALAAHLVVNRGRIVALFAVGSRPVRSSAIAEESARPAPPGVRPETAPQEARPGRRVRIDRRRSLLVAGGALAALIAALSLDRGRPRAAPAQRADQLGDYPVLNVESGAPAVSAAEWQLVVDGLVGTPLQLDRAAWLALPRTAETRDFHCVEGWSVDKLAWSGVSVAELLRRAAPLAQGRFVTFHAYGGSYSDSLALAEAQAPDTLLADSLDGVALPAAHGGPLRLVIPSQLGYKNVKWVVRLEVTAARVDGYWERNGGYPAEAPVA